MRHAYRLAVAVGLSAAVSRGAGAQTLTAPAERPSQGLFDRRFQDDQFQDDQRFTVSVSALSAYDDNLAAVQSGGAADFGQQSGGGSYNRVGSNIAFRKQFQHGDFAIAEGSTVHYYPSLNAFVSAQHAATASVALHLAHTKVEMTQTFALIPLFGIAFGPRVFSGELGALPPANSDLAMVRRDQLAIGSHATITQALGRRTSASFTVRVQTTDFVTDSTDQTTKTISGSLSRVVNRDLNLIIGYGLNDVGFRDTSVGWRTRVHNVDAGVDYRRALSSTRRTTIGFTTGSTMFETEGGGIEYRLIGDARLNHDFGRTWHAATVFRRGVGFIDGFQQPFFADSVALDVGGTASRRVNMTFGANYSRGELGLAASASRNDTYGATARLRVALSRRAMISSEYVFYHYRFDQAATLPAGLPAEVGRNGVRVGLEFWLPFGQ